MLRLPVWSQFGSDGWCQQNWRRQLRDRRSGPLWGSQQRPPTAAGGLQDVRLAECCLHRDAESSIKMLYRLEHFNESSL